MNTANARFSSRHRRFLRKFAMRRNRYLLSAALLGVCPVLASGQERVDLESWWSRDREDNFATTDPNWQGILGDRVAPGYTLYRHEGRLFSPASERPDGTIPVYSWYNDERGDNFLTSQRSWASNSLGEIREGYRYFRLEGFLYSPDLPQPTGTLPLYSWYHPTRGDNFATTDRRWAPRGGPEEERDGYRYYRLEGYVLPPARPQGIADIEPYVAFSSVFDTNRCAESVLEQLTPETGIDLNDRRLTNRFEFDVSFTRSDHVQGFARLRDVDNQGRLVLSENVTSDGIHLAFQPIEGADEGAYSTAVQADNRRATPIIGLTRFGNYGHPGGIQTMGDHVVVGMQSSNAGEPGAFFVLNAPSGGTGSLSLVAGHQLDGSQTEPRQRERRSQAGSAAITRLSDGRYLVAVYDDAQEDRIIWFYRSRTASLSPSTQWMYSGHFDPECKSYGTDADQCLAGAQGGLNFVTDCSSGLYLVGMDGDSGNRRSRHWYQVWRVGGPVNEISLVKVTQQRILNDQRPQRTQSFRWSGSLYVDRNGRIILYAADRQTGPSIARPSRNQTIKTRAWWHESE
ncbi:MAG: hypothetical protein WBA51_06015 [Erythrobacter sp.]